MRGVLLDTISANMTVTDQLSIFVEAGISTPQKLLQASSGAA
jgi:hypothetical protein